MANTLPGPRNDTNQSKRELSPVQQAVADVYNATRSRKFRAQIMEALPPRMKGEQAVDYFCSGLYSAVRRNPALLNVQNPQTLYKSAIEAAEKGIRLDNGEGWLVPYKGEVALQLGYKGAIKLARQAGILMIDAQPVYANDICKINLGTDPSIDHTPNMSGSRGELLGVYAWIRMSEGEPPLIEWMPLEEIEKIRKSGPSANSPAWKSWFDEMARAKVLKRIAKRVPAKDELDLATLLQDADDRTIEGHAEAIDPTFGVVEGGRSEGASQSDEKPSNSQGQIEQGADPKADTVKETAKAKAENKRKQEAPPPPDDDAYGEMDF